MDDTIREEIGIKEPGLARGWWDWFIIIAASIFVLYHVIYVSDLLFIFTPITSPPYFHTGVHLASILFFTFLLVRARKGVKTDKPPVDDGVKTDKPPVYDGVKTDKPPVYDVVLAFVALVVPIYYAFNLVEMRESVGEGILLYPVFGWLLAALLLEASRRLLGIPFTCVVACFLFYPLVSGHFPGVLYHPSLSLVKVGEFMVMSNNGIMGFIMYISSTIVVVFILFSQLLLHSGAGKFFIDLAYGAFGAVRGGPAKMAVVASGLFGTLSGSPASNVAATGTFTIPLMMKVGYKPHFAGAVECVASLGGMFMPPVMGSMIFILCDFIGMSYIEVCKRAVIPAVLYYAALFIMVDQEAVRLGLRGLAKETLPSLWKTLKQGFWYLIPIIVLVYLMAGLHYSPQKSALWAFVILIGLSMFRKETRMGPMKLGLASEGTLRAMLMIAVAIACAGIILGGFALTGVGIAIGSQLAKFTGGNLLIITTVVAATSFILGMGVGPLGIYVFLSLTLVPAMVAVGVPEFAAHFFIFYWSMVSYITPPVAVLAFIAAGFAQARPWKVGWTATRLGILIYVLPFAWVFKPALVGFGTPMEVVVTIASVAIGTVGLAFGTGGHFMRKLNWLQRVMSLAGGMLLIFGHSATLIGGGALILVIAVLWQWLKIRLARRYVGQE